MSGSSLVDISDATKRFAAPEGGHITALDTVTLHVMDKEFITLLGPSGCGKTTLLRTLSGFEDLDSGSISIDGQPMAHVPAHRRPRGCSGRYLLGRGRSCRPIRSPTTRL